MSSVSLKIDQLSGGYGDVTIVRDICLEVQKGQVVFITGRNGVGKSTLMKLIAGQLVPDSGKARYLENDLALISSHDRQQSGIGYAPQEHVIFDNLTVLENLTLHYKNRDITRYEELFGCFPKIKQRLGQLAGTLSGGEKKILSFCRVMGEGTHLVLLDEPSEGVQPENINHMAATITKQSKQGRSFLIVEQNLSLLETCADHVYLIDHGVCIFDAPKSPDIRSLISSRLTI